MMYPHSHYQKLELKIREILTRVREQSPENYTMPTFCLYEEINASLGNISSALFNKAVGSMKRANIIGTAKGGEVAFLSHAAWAALQARAEAKIKARRYPFHEAFDATDALGGGQ
jgi:hypothetical protein